MEEIAPGRDQDPVILKTTSLGLKTTRAASDDREKSSASGGSGQILDHDLIVSRSNFYRPGEPWLCLASEGVELLDDLALGVLDEANIAASTSGPGESAGL